MIISTPGHPHSIHLCTLAPGQQEYEDALRGWFTRNGYPLLAHSQDPLPVKLKAAYSCDLCLLVLGPEFGPKDPLSSFSHTELEASAACDDVSGRLYIVAQTEVADPAHLPASVFPEQRDFIRRMLHFTGGFFASTCSSPKELLGLLPQMIESWRPPVQEAPMHPQIRHDAIMISSTGTLSEERRIVSQVLHQQDFPLIDYKTALLQPVPPLEWVIKSARQCRAVFLIMGPDYGTDIPFEGLGATELEFESALEAGVPIYSFLRSDAPVPGKDLPGANQDQAQFVERVLASLPGDQVYFFQEKEHEWTLANQVYEALVRLRDRRPIGSPSVIDGAKRQRWYRRRIQRWMGTLPHLTRKEGMPLERVYMTLQTLPEEYVRQKDEEREESVIFQRDRGERAEAEEKKKVKTLSVDGALKQFPRLVLQGNPGCGKSVALRWYALTADERVTPIFIQLALYAQALESGQVVSLEAYVRQQEQHFLQTSLGDASLWLADLHGGQALLLLDALDEVPQRDYQRPDGTIVPLQEQVLASILAFANRLPLTSRIALTTRATGFDPRRVEGVFTVTQVQPLTPPQQRQFIRYWLRAAHPDHSETITETVTRITVVLQRQTNLNSWARTPLMLTLLTALADALGADFLAQPLTKAAVLRQALRLMLGQWSALGERERGKYLWSKEFLLLSLAWQNLEGGRREAMTREDVLKAWQALPPEVQHDLTADRVLAELSAVDGFLTPIGEQTYTFYHSMFQEYLGASYLTSLSESEQQRILERHRLNEQWEETTQLLVSELDRCGRYTEADAIVETLIAADDRPLLPHTWKDPFHLALIRAARCQGVRAREQGKRPAGERVAVRWGSILQQTLSDFHQQQHLREQACQAIFEMGAAAKYAYPDLHEMFTKWKAARDGLGNALQQVWFPRLPAIAIEALGNFRDQKAEQQLRDLLQREEGIGENQAAALKAWIRLGPDAARSARDLLIRFIGAQGAMGADPTHATGELAATLLLQLSPNVKELEMIARLGSVWEQEALWATLSLDPAEVVPFLRSWISAGPLLPGLWRSFFDFKEDTYIEARLEGLEVARRLGSSAEPLLDVILYRAIFDVERNRRVAEEVFLSFGARAVMAFNTWLVRHYPNEEAREIYFQHILHRLKTATNADEINTYLKMGINQVLYIEQEIIDERNKPYRDKEEAEQEQRKREERENLHRALRSTPFFQIVRDVEHYGAEAIEFLDDLIVLAENENASVDARIMALRQIKKLGPSAGKACPILCKLVHDPQYSTDAFEALVALKFAAIKALLTMQQLLQDEYWVKRAYAVEVIGWLGPGAAPVLPDLLAILRDPKNLAQGQYMVRKAVIKAFGRLWPLTRPYLNDLRDALLHDSHSAVRKAAAEVLGQIGVNEPSVIEAVHTALTDSSARSEFSDSNVPQAAARALTSILARSDLPEDVPVTPVVSGQQEQSKSAGQVSPPRKVKRSADFFSRHFGHKASSQRRAASSFEGWENLKYWLAITDIPEARKFLEDHLELVRPQSERAVENLIRSIAGEGVRSARLRVLTPLLKIVFRIVGERGFSPIEWQKMNSAILRHAIAAGGTRQAVHDAYIDEIGAMAALDLPPWLAIIRTRIAASLQRSGPDLMLLIQEAVNYASSDHNLEPEILATLQTVLGEGLIEKDPSTAIEVWVSATRVFTPQRFPKQSAEIQKSLSRGYLKRAFQNDNDQDFLHAIPCIEAALEYFTLEKDLKEWVQLHVPLSMCHAATGNYDHGRQILEEVLALLPASTPSALIQMVQEPLRKLEAAQQAMDEQQHAFDMLEMLSPDVARRLRNEVFRPEEES